MKKKILSVLLALVLALSLCLVTAVPAVAANPGDLYVDDDAVLDGTAASGTTGTTLVATGAVFVVPHADVGDVVEFLTGSAAGKVTTIATYTSDTTVTLAENVGATGDDTFNLVDMDAPSDADPFRYIQSAIDCATSFDTINVAAGTYNEAVTIGKPLALLGAQHGEDPTVDGARTEVAEESIIDTLEQGEGYEQGAVVISADSVTVDGFTITGAQYNAIWTFGYCGNTITNNILSNNGYRGVQIGTSDQSVAVGNTVTNNVMSHNGREGIFVWGWGSGDNTIENNVISYSGRPGIFIRQATDNTIENNVISYSGEVDSTEWVGGISLDTAFRNTLTGNTLSNQCRGIIMWDSVDTTLTRNTISNNEYGIYLRLSKWAGHAGSEAYRNNIVDNTHGVYNVDNLFETETFDATNNWWGAYNGPSGQGPGDGDSVSENVLFEPWLLSSIEAGGTGAVSMTAASEEAMIGISVLPTSIDFGAITSEAIVGGDQLIVSNLGNVAITVDAEMTTDTYYNAEEDYFYTAALRLNHCASDQARNGGDLSTLGKWAHSEYLGEQPIEVGNYRTVNTGLECPLEILAGETYQGTVVFWAEQPE